MGLAASQARLLTLTSRQHTLEGRAQRIMAEKQRLANDSGRVYQKYINALDETTIKTKQINESGQERWIDASLLNLLRYEAAEDTSGTIFFVQKLIDGKIYIPKEFGVAFDNSEDKYAFAEKFGVTYTYYDPNENIKIEYEKAFEAGWSTYPANSEEYKQFVEIKAQYDNRDPYYQRVPSNLVMANYYETIYNAINAADGWEEIPDGTAKSASWVTNMVRSTQVILTTWDPELEILSKTADSLHYNLREEANNHAILKADQEYETDLAVINDKDAQYDVRLQKLDAERDAIKTEIDSLKRVAKENVERTFKVFS